MAVFGSVGRFAAIAFLAWAGAAPAAETAAGNRATSVEDSIAATRRELQLLKSAAHLSEVDGANASATPSIALPDFHPGTEAVTPPSQTQNQPTTAEPGTRNLLLEAMRGPHAPRPDGMPLPGQRGELNLEPNRADDPLATKKSESNETPEGSNANSTEDAARTARAEPVFNPLTKYMADWISPRDYAVMKPVFERAGRSALPTGDSSVASANGEVGLDLTALAGLTEDNNLPRPTVSTSNSADNPFLAGLTAPEPLPPTPISTPLFAPPPPPAVTPPPPPPPPPERSTIPDFAKQGEDDKYYKPLKRF